MIKKLNKLAKPLALIGLCCAVTFTVQGCVELAIGGAVIGSIATSDRRTFGAQTDDKTIVVKGELRVKNALGGTSHVNVNSFNRRVLLTGEVADEEAKATAEREIRALDGVVGVTNELTIGFTSGIGARSNDTLITTKVKAALIDTRDIYASAFKIVTEAGTVYLMGRVTQFEGNAAADATRGVSGVKKVVKVFEYIDENELKKLTPQTATPTTTESSSN